MIRHTQPREEAISFVAFLSVVSCTIGLLIFVLVGVTVVSFWGAEQVVVEVKGTGHGRPGAGRIYVECRPDGLIVHPDKVVVSLQDLEDPSRWIEGPFGKCLSKLTSSGRGGSVFFLVRRGGFPVYRKTLEYTLTFGGGTVEAVSRGDALFSIGHQLVVMPGALRVVLPNAALPEPEAPRP